MAGRGFTLFELLVALCLLTVLSLLAAPAFGNFLRDCRRTAATEALAHSVHAARLLAGVRGVPVELCPTRNGRDCADTTDWGSTLLLHSAGVPAPGAAPATIIGLPQGNPPLIVRANRAAIRFLPLVPAATTATVTVCDDRGDRAAVAIIVSRSGRPRVSSRDASGAPLECP